MVELVRYHQEAGIARLTVTQAETGNALTWEMGLAFWDGVRRAREARARVLVIAADGHFFSVGPDFAAFAAAEDPFAFVDDLADLLHRVVSELMHSDMIVVSAVNGLAAGPGFALACAADVVVASTKAKFSLAYANLGMSPDGGSSLLVHSLGLHRVLRLSLLGELLSAEEAQRAGLLAHVVPPDQLDDTIEYVVALLAAGSRDALASTKRIVRAAAEAAPESVMRREALSVRELAASEDGREGVAAFLEGRPPKFATE